MSLLHYTHLRIRHFRNIKALDISFNKGLNAITGPNGAGKSSLLEALAIIGTGNSFRTHRLHHCIQWESERFILEGWVEKHAVPQSVKIIFSGQERSLLMNSSRYSSLQPLLGFIPQITILSSDHELISAGPDTRRQFLDQLLSECNPLYTHHLIRYQKALRQRNILLAQRITHTLPPWEEALATAAHYIVEERRKTVVELAQKIPFYYRLMTQRDTSLFIHYRSSFLHGGERTLTKEEICGRYEQRRNADLVMKRTLQGPHRDEIEIRYQKELARTHASEGENRAIAIAFRLAQSDIAMALNNLEPIILCDDLALFLDRAKQERLLDLLLQRGQLFIVGASERADERRFRLEGGAVTQT